MLCTKKRWPHLVLRKDHPNTSKSIVSRPNLIDMFSWRDKLPSQTGKIEPKRMLSLHSKQFQLEWFFNLAKKTKTRQSKWNRSPIDWQGTLCSPTQLLHFFRSIFCLHSFEVQTSRSFDRSTGNQGHVSIQGVKQWTRVTFLTPGNGQLFTRWERLI